MSKCVSEWGEEEKGRSEGGSRDRGEEGRVGRDRGVGYGILSDICSKT